MTGIHKSAIKESFATYMWASSSIEDIAMALRDAARERLGAELGLQGEELEEATRILLEYYNTSTVTSDTSSGGASKIDPVTDN